MLVFMSIKYPKEGEIYAGVLTGHHAEIKIKRSWNDAVSVHPLGRPAGQPIEADVPRVPDPPTKGTPWRGVQDTPNSPGVGEGSLLPDLLVHSPLTPGPQDRAYQAHLGITNDDEGRRSWIIEGKFSISPDLGSPPPSECLPMFTCIFILRAYASHAWKTNLCLVTEELNLLKYVMRMGMFEIALSLDLTIFFWCCPASPWFFLSSLLYTSLLFYLCPK